LIIDLISPSSNSTAMAHLFIHQVSGGGGGGLTARSTSKLQAVNRASTY
jgi:hypothetical protein